jgi:hypothetical protein
VGRGGLVWGRFTKWFREESSLASNLGTKA